MKVAIRKVLNIGKWVGITLIIIFGLLASSYKVWLDEAHPVVKNQLYRSAQLSSVNLVNAIRKDKIKTIINLRGRNPKEPWYQQEVLVARKMGVQHYDVAMSAYKLPEKQKLVELVTLLRAAPKPILVHCEGGADRTGLASAIYLILQNKPLKAAKSQYSFTNYVISDQSVGKLVIPMYRNWLHKNGLQSSRQNFLDWLKQY